MNMRDRWLNSASYGPDMEGGSDGGDNLPIDGGGGNDSGLGSSEDLAGDEGEGQADKPLSVRQQLKKSIKDLQGGDKGGKTQRAADEMRQGAQDDKGQQQQQPQGQQQQQQQSGIQPPASLSKEAKAAWANTPAEVQQAFVKREQDMEKGVNELKQRYQQIDNALAPHTDSIRQMNATPAEAVDRLFLWFKAFAGDPAEALPQLMKAMGYDWGKVNAEITRRQGGQQQQQPQGQQQGQQQQQQPNPVFDAMQNRIQQLEQHIQKISGGFSTMQQDVQRQNFQKTQENLSIWAKGKPHYEAVRGTMAQIIQGGLVPLLENGQVDLDTVYERAIHFNPEVRAKVLAEQQQANQQAQEQARQAATTANQQQVRSARRASVSLPANGTPGDARQLPGQQKKKPGQRTSVRESLMGAINELREG
jgi:hypothetical protein